MPYSQHWQAKVVESFRGLEWLLSTQLQQHMSPSFPFQISLQKPSWSSEEWPTGNLLPSTSKNLAITKNAAVPPATTKSPKAPTEEKSIQDAKNTNTPEGREEERKRFLERCDFGVKRLIELRDQQGWKKISESSGVIVSTKDIQGSLLPIVRGEGIIEQPPVIVLDLLWDTQRKSQYDIMFQSARVIRTFSQKAQIEHHVYGSALVPFITQRDFCILAYWDHLEDGSYVLCAQSVEFRDCPSTTERIRSEIIVGGFFIRPLPENPQHSHVVFLGQSDVKGSLPDRIKREICVRQPMLIHAVNEALRGVDPSTVDISRFQTAETTYKRKNEKKSA